MVSGYCFVTIAFDKVWLTTSWNDLAVKQIGVSEKIKVNNSIQSISLLPRKTLTPPLHTLSSVLGIMRMHDSYQEQRKENKNVGV